MELFGVCGFFSMIFFVLLFVGLKLVKFCLDNLSVYPFICAFKCEKCGRLLLVGDSKYVVYGVLVMTEDVFCV